MPSLRENTNTFLGELCALARNIGKIVDDGGFDTFGSLIHPTLSLEMQWKEFDYSHYWDTS